jgi:hypothetical protein
MIPPMIVGYDTPWEAMLGEDDRDLLIGGDKAGKTKRFYKKMIPVADRIYDRHLRELVEHKGGKEHQDAKEKKAVQRAKQGSQKAPRRRR